MKTLIVSDYDDAKALNYPDRSFDIVITPRTIHMISPAEVREILALNELVRKMRPGGLLIIEVSFRKKCAVNCAKRDNFEQIYTWVPLFTERQYVNHALKSGIIDNLDAELYKEIYLYEKLSFDSAWSRLSGTVAKLLVFIEPWAVIINISVASLPITIKQSNSAMLVFKFNDS